MPIDCRYTTKTALLIFTVGWFFVLPVKSQNYHSFFFGGTGVETINSITLSSDTLILSGNFNQAFQWGDFNLESNGDQDFYIASTDMAGRPFHLLTGGSIREDDITNLIKLPNGNLIIGGTYWGEGYFLDTLYANPASSKNGFLTVFTPTGIPVWRSFISGSGGIAIKSIALTGQKIYAAGTFEKSLSIGDTIIFSNYPQNLWVAEFSDAGVFQKVVQFNATNNLSLIKMIVLPEGRLVLGGQFNHSLIFPNDTLQANTFDDDIFILSLNGQLEINWYLKGGGVHRDALIDLVSNSQNQIIAAGDFVGRLSFSDGQELNSADGIGDGFLVSFNQNGKLLWQENLGGMNFQGIHAVHTFNESVLVIGSFETQLVIENEIVATALELERQVFLGYFDLNGAFQEIEIFQNSAQFFPSQIFGNPPNIGITGSFANNLLIGSQSFYSPSNYQALVVNLNQSTTAVYNPSKNYPSIKVFPNPTNNYLQWNQSLNFKKITLYHANGHIIKSIDSPHNTLQLPPLTPGYYYIQFIDESGRVYSTPFVKN